MSEQEARALIADLTTEEKQLLYRLLLTLRQEPPGDSSREEAVS